MLATKITEKSQLFYEDIIQLYHRSFPANERRAWTEVELILKTDKRFNMLLFTNDNCFSGFLNYWDFNSFVYVEHFAVSEQKRGQGIGKEIMKSFIVEQKTPIILEVEIPENAESIRRIAFYEKLGFSVISRAYFQPPYDKKTDFLALLIMTNNLDFGNNSFEKIRETLYKEVYGLDKE